MKNITEHIDALLRAMPPITLEQMSEIRLMKRTDQKYLTNLPTLLRLLEMTRDSYYSQEIEGRRISPYATTYWDDPSDLMFRTHQAGHAPRRKVRVRTYLSSDQSFLEVKKKDNHGKTSKSRVPVPSLQAVLEEQAGQDFLQQKTGFSLEHLVPTVGNRFNRITLVNRAKTERLTIDFDIQFYNYKTQLSAAMSNIVVIELKRDGRVPSPILPMLRTLRIKPSGFSKYCIGACVTDPTLRVNRFKKRLIRVRKVSQKATFEQTN
ncbi:MAG: polyphosphate polymerase domain-containing protein [Alloprevotella sp.]